MDDILNRCAGLQLLEKEETKIVIGAPVIDSHRVLAGKFFTKRRVNLESVARVLRSVWKTTQNFEVSDLGDNKALFLFQNDDPIDTIVLSKLRVSYLEPLLLLSQKQENNFEITLILE